MLVTRARWLNCLHFALVVWVRMRCRPWLSIRRSHWGPFPHAALVIEHEDCILRVEYVPDCPRRRWIPPPVFAGHLQAGCYRGCAQPCEHAAGLMRAQGVGRWVAIGQPARD